MEKEMKEEVMLENGSENKNVVYCEEPKVLSRRIVKEDGVEFTEEELELVDPEGRASTITVKYTAGKPLNSVYFSPSGYGTNVYCSYQVFSKFLNSQSWDRDLSTTRYAKDVGRTFSNVPTLSVPGPYDQVCCYRFHKYVRNSSTQTNPTREFVWTRELRGSGTTN
ncbi:MAG: hypothetical protein ACRCXT_06985 [Paraclostridium sp.]